MSEKKLELTSSQLRQLQIECVHILCEIDRVCRKNGLEYSIDGGTLLGAARHGGFIPWDDDADTIMTRHQYTAFRKACEKDLDKEHFFLQDIYTDRKYRWRYAKLRKKGTLYKRPGQDDVGHDGIFCDIFILDNIPDNELLRYPYAFFNHCTRKLLYSEVGKRNADSSLMRGVYSALSKIPKEMVFKVQNTVWKHFDRRGGELLCHNGFPYQPKWGAPREIFTEYVDMEFEGITFRAVKEWDRYLKLVYGDYMTLPPKDKQVPHTECTDIKFSDITLEKLREQYGK